VCGIHFAFNGTAILAVMVAAGAADPSLSPLAAFGEAIKAGTGMTEDPQIAGAAVQLLVFATLSALVWLRLKRQGRL
jgi:hypothetical protein